MSEVQPFIGRVLKDLYRIDSYLGEGGPSIVYKGTDLNLDVPVAIKRLKMNVSTGNNLMSERFLREARTQAQLIHQHIVGIRSMLVEDDDYFIVMEFVEGQDLSDLMLDESGKGRKMDFSEAVSLFSQALDGLGYAHQHDVIHRDIKPSNILVTKNNNVKIADFGIARVLDDQRLTKTGFLIGTPIYMSPEQLRSHNVDLRSDLYSMGVSLYEALAGIPPFGANEDSSTYEIMSQHLFESPPALRLFRKDLTMAQEAVVMKSLQKEPNDRYQTATEFIEALRSVNDNPDQSASAFSTDLTPLQARLNREQMLPSSEEIDLNLISSSSDLASQETLNVDLDSSSPKKEKKHISISSQNKILQGLLILVAILLLLIYVFFSDSSSTSITKNIKKSNKSAVTSRNSSQLGTEHLRTKKNHVPRRIVVTNRQKPSYREMPSHRQRPSDVPNVAPPHSKKPSFVPQPRLSNVKISTINHIQMVRIPAGWFFQGFGKPHKRVFSMYLSKRMRRKIRRMERRERRRQRRLRRRRRRRRRRRNNAWDSRRANREYARLKLTPRMLYKLQKNDHPKRKIYVGAFWMDRFEVTARQYRKCVEDNSCSKVRVRLKRGNFLEKLVGKPTNMSSYLSPETPIRYVTWEQALQYCKWVGKRLPTEAEWERAARGDSYSLYPWGKTRPNCSLAVFRGCQKRPSAVGVHRRPHGVSPYGVYDMSGNVWEWVHDCYQRDIYTRQKKRKNPLYDQYRCKKRIVRGGSFQSRVFSPGLKSYYRRPLWFKHRRADVGFRCASTNLPKIQTNSYQ